MRKIILLIGCLFSLATASAQINKGGVQINGGLGVSGAGTMIYGAADFGITKQISLGGELFFRFDSYSGIGYTNVGILATSNFHFAEYLRIRVPLDLYGGLSLGYYNWGMNTKDDWIKSYYDSGIAFRFQSGARYFFNKHFAGNLEWFVENNAFSTGGIKAGITYLF